MSFMDKMKASVGIGGATVDAKLVRSRVKIGGTVEGTVVLTGGKVEQKANGLTLHVRTTVIKKQDDNTIYLKKSIFKIPVSGPFTIRPGIHLEFPFSFALPYSTPLTIGKQEVWLQTELDVPLALDPKDRDLLTVEPNHEVNAVLQAMSRLGFQIRKAECEHSYAVSDGFVQEFEFVPSGGEFRGRIKELDCVIRPHEQGVTLHLEVDKKGRGLSGMLQEATGLNERRLTLSLTSSQLSDPAYVLSSIREVIR